MPEGAEILIVDDNAPTVEVMARVLEQVGYGVAHTGDFETAQRGLRALKPRLVLLNTGLANRRGMEAFNQFRNQALLRNASMVLLRGEESIVAPDRDELRLEADGSVGSEELLACVRFHLRQRELTEQLRSSEELFANAFAYAPIGVALVGLDGRYQKVNRALCRFLGYAERELLTRHYEEITHWEDRDDQGKGDKLLAGAIESYELEKRYVHKSGRLVWGLLSVSLARDSAGEPAHLIAQIQDITERKRAAEAAREEQHFSATMFESMPGVLYLYNAHGVFLRWNRNLEAVTGLTPAELACKNPLDFFQPDEKDRVAERIAEVFEKGESSIEAPFLSKDGSTKPYYFTGRRVMLNGAPCLVGVGIDISERKQAEQALAESEHKLRVLFDQAPLGIGVLDSKTGSFLSVNAQYCRITGYTKEEMTGRNFQSITHPDDLAVDLENMRRLREGLHDWFRIEKRYFRKDGSIVWVGLTCVRLWEEAGTELRHIAMVEDITERKQAVTRLAESERQYRDLVELANSIILRWNSEGKITFLNEYGQRFFGYSGAEILGRHVVGTIVANSDASGRDLRDLMDQICASPEAFENNINENIRRNGERVWIAWTNRILRDAQGQVAEILSVGTDITERRRAEMALRELNETLEHRVEARTGELQAALVRAESADRIKSSFLAAMSHELRTPLNSIIGFTGIVLQGLAGPLNAEQIKQLGMVRGSARHLLELINDVLDLSKIEAGQLEVGAASFDLRASINQVVGLIKPLADKKGLVWHVEISPDLREWVSDRRRVEQILINLLNNAVKFTEHGSVTLIAECFDPSPAAPHSPPKPVARFRVKDTGIGIKESDLAVLFQPFRQLDTGLARQHEGTGLGLAICRKLASLLGGDVTATSEWSRGSEFTLVLPQTTRKL